MLWQNIALGITGVFTLENIAFMILGVVVGIIFGALPGFSATMGVAVFVPFSYVLEPGAAMLLLSGVYCGAVYGGSIPAVLIGIPGRQPVCRRLWKDCRCCGAGKEAELFLWLHWHQPSEASVLLLRFCSELRCLLLLRCGWDLLNK